MNGDDPRLALVRDNAAFAIRELGKARGEPMDLSPQSIAWIEGFIERQRRKFADEQARGGLVSVLGSYLGEAIIEATDGAWDTDDNGALGVRFACGDWCYPFNKVDKQFEQGVEGGESILSFYNVCVNMIAAGRLRQAEGGAP
jgi:hypothetical protein